MADHVNDEGLLCIYAESLTYSEFVLGSRCCWNRGPRARRRRDYQLGRAWPSPRPLTSWGSALCRPSTVILKYAGTVSRCFFFLFFTARLHTYSLYLVLFAKELLISKLDILILFIQINNVWMEKREHFYSYPYESYTRNSSARNSLLKPLFLYWWRIYMKIFKRAPIYNRAFLN